MKYEMRHSPYAVRIIILILVMIALMLFAIYVHYEEPRYRYYCDGYAQICQEEHYETRYSYPIVFTSTVYNDVPCEQKHDRVIERCILREVGK